MKGMTRHAAAAALLAATVIAGPAQAQGFPKGTVSIVIPYPPGGSAGMQARLLANDLAEQWKQQVIVVDKPGAGTTIGAAHVAEAPADGHSLYLAGTSHTISANLYKNLRYDAVKSFAPVSMLATSPFIVVAKPDLKVQTLKDLIALAKARPGELRYASSGNGAGPHLSGELLKSMAGINLVHVPYKGSAPALQDALGGHVEVLMADVSAIPHIQAGKLKALAVTTGKRSTLLPDVPTVAEAGLPGYETVNWSAILAPAGTPKDVVALIHASIRRALDKPDVQAQYRQSGFEVAPSTPEALGAHLAAEVEKYGRVIKESNTKID
jgi:tripartite-type tricarboxylate transporter receptor subunit TctC